MCSIIEPKTMIIPDTVPTAPVRQLKELLREKWPEACPPQGPRAQTLLRTGMAPLDRLFGPGGMPRAQLLEITGRMAAGKTRLLFALLAVLARQGTVIYCDLARTLFPPALQAAQVDLQRIRIVQPASPAAGLRQVELLCAEQALGAAVLDLVGEKRMLPETLLHRLRRGAVKTGATMIFLTDGARLIPPSMLSLRLGVRRVGATRIAATVLASRISPAGVTVELDFDA
jgi:hypothetical protein